MGRYDVEDAFNNYFGIQVTPAQESAPIEEKPPTYTEFLKVQSNTKTINSDKIPTGSRVSQVAKGNISTVNDLGEKLRMLFNAAWGDDWGIVGPLFKKGENANDIKFPQITYNTYSRETAEKTPPKPILTEYIKEVVDGTETGDAWAVYRQWFDCVLEFDIWGRNTYECHTKADEFELLISTYSWFLKQAGIAEITFLKEVPPKESANYIEGLAMKPLLYYVRLERIQSIKISTFNQIKILLQNNTVNNTDDIYKQSKIKYNLD